MVQSLLQNPDFRVRAITGLPNSQKAKELSSLGVEVLQTDGLDKDALCQAFSNAWAAFVDTSPEDPVSTVELYIIPATLEQCTGTGSCTTRHRRRRPGQYSSRVRRAIRSTASGLQFRDRSLRTDQWRRFHSLP